MYVAIDDQSNCSLAKPELFDLLDKNGTQHPIHSEDVCGNHTHQRVLRQRPCYRDNRWVETLPTLNCNRVHRHPGQ